MSNIRTYEITHSKQKPLPIKQKNSTDYLLGGSLVMRNGKIDKYLFEGGYAQATSASKTTDTFAFYYYNQDHLGNNREVVDASGVVQQVTNYYPFGAPYADATASKGSDVQSYKYNGKELDLMHGLNTYDYGARQHDPILARWDRIDPLCEEFYNVSPYNYCMNNPVKNIDPDGRIPFVANAVGALVGAGVEVVSQAATNYFDNRSVTDINWAKVGVAGAEGFVTCGTSAVKNTAAKLAVKAGTALASAASKAAIDAKDGNGSFVGNTLSNLASTAGGKAVGKMANVIKPKVLATTSSKVTSKLIPSKNKTRKLVKKVTGLNGKEARTVANISYDVQKDVAKAIGAEMRNIHNTISSTATSIHITVENNNYSKQNSRH